MSSSSLPYMRNISLILLKYLRIFLTAIQSSEPGLDWYLLVKLIACATSGLIHSMTYIIDPMAEAYGILSIISLASLVVIRPKRIYFLEHFAIVSPLNLC